MNVVELVLFFLAILGGLGFGISVGWEMRGYREQRLRDEEWDRTHHPERAEKVTHD